MASGSAADVGLMGVMVDLGWPWWVTTIIAAAVAAACIVLWRPIRHAPARAVLAVLVIEGVAIAIAAPFLMEDPGRGPASDMIRPAMAPPAPPAMSESP